MRLTAWSAYFEMRLPGLSIICLLLSRVAVSQVPVTPTTSAPLFRAIYADDVHQVIELLHGGANPNVKDRYGWTPLTRASEGYHPNLAILRALLDAGAKVNSSYDGDSALSEAAGRGATDAIELLLQHGADVHKRDMYGRTPLIAAAGNSEAQPKIVNMLLARGAKVNVHDPSGTTPLLAALNMGTSSDEDVVRQRAIVEALVAAGADIRVADQRGTTPLMAAVYHGRMWSVKLLLDRGAEVNVRDRSGKNAFLYLYNSLFRDFEKDAWLLLEHGIDVGITSRIGESALPMIAEGGDASLMSAVLERGAPINGRDDRGRTALMTASDPDYRQKVDILLEHGADPRARDRYGATVLMHAASNQDPEVIQRLIRLGVDPRAHDREGKTALSYVRGIPPEHVEETLRVLNETGIDLEGRDRSGRTALIISCDHGGWGMHSAGSPGLEYPVRALLKLGADVHARDRDGRTPIIASAMSRQPDEVAGLLLSGGGDPNAHDTKGLTPLMWAARFAAFDEGKIIIGQELIKLLRDRGARVGLIEAVLLHDEEAALGLIAAGSKPNARGPYNQTPLHTAAESAQPRVVAALLAAGADANMRDEFGMTPLLHAVIAWNSGIGAAQANSHSEKTDEHVRVEIVRALLARGADPNAHFTPRTDPRNWGTKPKPETALQWAEQWSYTEIAAMLKRQIESLTLRRSPTIIDSNNEP